MTARGTAASLALFAAFVTASPPAAGFCRTKACDTDPSYGDVWDEGPQPTECVRNANGCFTEGTPLFWRSGCVPFSVQRDGSPSSRIDAEAATAVIEKAFDQWTSVDCGDNPPSVRAFNLGPVSCDLPEYNQQGPNANVFLFRERDWPYANIPHSIALTTITYNVETAEIYDVDVEFNAAHNRFTISDDPDQIVFDLPSVVTHEVGHVLGLSHSEDSAAVMRSTGYSAGSTALRELTQDDIDGVCDVFPPGSRSTRECRVRHGFGDECGGRAKDDAGCSVGRARPRGAHGLLSFAALVGAMLGLRRRARAGRGINPARALARRGPPSA